MMTTTAPAGHAPAPVAVVELLDAIPRSWSRPASRVRPGPPAGARGRAGRGPAVPVSRVSRVANVKTSASAPPAAQYSSCSMARAYGSIDPEMSHSTTSRRGSHQAGARPGQPERMTAGAPGVAQRRPQVGAPAVRGGPGPPGPAQRHREGELAHEPGQHQQLGRGQLGEVLAREPFRRAGDHAPGGLGLVLRAGFLILLFALGHHLLIRGQFGLLGRAVLGGVRAGGAGRLGQDVARRPGPGLARHGLAGRPAAPPGHRTSRRRPGPAPRSAPGWRPGWRGRTGSRARPVVGRATVTARGEPLAPAGIRRQPPQRAGPRRTGRQARSPGPVSSVTVSQPAETGGPDGLQILGILQHRARGPLRPTRCPGRRCAEHVQGLCPADGLGHARAAWRGPGHAAGPPRGPPGRPACRREAGTRRLMMAATRSIVRVVDPVVQAAPFQRVVQVPGPVGGQHHDRRRTGPAGSPARGWSPRPRRAARTGTPRTRRRPGPPRRSAAPPGAGPGGRARPAAAGRAGTPR